MELARLCSSAETRLVTILGPAGVGKTRLAIEAARRLAGGVPPFHEAALDAQNVALGIYFVDLAPLTSAEMISFAIARTLGFRLAPQVEPRRQLFDYLRNKSLLLVLDNFERLLEGASVITELVAVAPRVRVLATSRERMGLQSETLLPLAGLPTPVGPKRYSPESLGNHEAGQLLMAQIAEVYPDLSLSTHAAGNAALLCRALEGNPLGLLLAARALESSDLEMSMGRLQLAAERAGPEFISTPALVAAQQPTHSYSDSPWGLLDDGQSETSGQPLQVGADEEPGVRLALHNVVQVAWSRLTDSERVVLRRASVFREVFGVEAARSVLGVAPPELERLVRKGLMDHDAATGLYQIHGTIRAHTERALQQALAEAAQTQEEFTSFYGRFSEAKA